MVKVTPLRNSFNGGEFSILTEGRVDIDRYPASMRAMLNCIAAPQGPSIGRSGTRFETVAYAQDSYSALVPFYFNEEDSFLVEFSAGMVRFINDDGPLVFPAVAITNILQIGPLKFTAPGHGLTVGSDAFLSGFPLDTNGNNRTVRVTAVSGDDVTFDYTYNGATGVPATAAVSSKIYKVSTPGYNSDDVRKINYVQKNDVMYLFRQGKRVFKLARYDVYDWRFSEVKFVGGPFMPKPKKCGTLALSGTGRSTPNMTSANTPSGVVGGDAGTAGHEGYKAFDGDASSYFESANPQKAILSYQFAAPKVIDSYILYLPKVTTDTIFTTKDKAPSFWTFDASNDGATWTTLDQQNDYVLWDSGRSAVFGVNNTTAYSYYRLNVSRVFGNGATDGSGVFTGVKVNIGELIFQSSTGPENTINVVLSGTYDEINNGAGFKATDVGRLIRMRGSDNIHRIAEITAYTNSTHVQINLLGSPFLTNDPVLDWQLGYWSDTSGWPTVGTFYADRMFLAGVLTQPNLVCASSVGSYEDFTSITETDVVLDAGAMTLNLNTKHPSPIRWLANDEKGILIGTGSGEHIIRRVTEQQALTSRNVEAVPTSQRGSADVQPSQIDKQVLYVQTAKRTLRELAYVYESDGYKSPSMSLFASHLGVPNFEQIDYAAEPHNLLWVRRTDGSVVALTYNRDENVIGWHRHDFGGFVESIACVLSPADKQHKLWMVIVRQVDGNPRRFIEKLDNFWDFGNDISNAFFVDSGLVYSGAPVTRIYGFDHLAGDTVDGLVNGVPFFDLPVSDNGSVDMPLSAVTSFVGGKKYQMYGEISRLEGGSQIGTSQGKRKRIGNVVVHLWDSYFGELGMLNEENGEIVWVEVRYDEDLEELQMPNLQTGMFGPMTEDAGFGKKGTIYFRQTQMYPFNVIALMPTMETQDP